jgi:hypothetical protein
VISSLYSLDRRLGEPQKCSERGDEKKKKKKKASKERPLMSDTNCIRCNVK